MLTTSDVLFGLLLPLLLMTGAVFVAGAWSRHVDTRASLWRSRAVLCAGLTIVFVLGWVVLFGVPTQVPPLLATDWVVFVLPALACFGLLDARLRFPSPARIGAVMFLCGLSAWCVMKPLVDARTVAPSQGATAMTAITLLCVLWWASVELLEKRGQASRAAGTVPADNPPTSTDNPLISARNPLTSAGVLMVLSVSIAVVLLLSGSQSLGQKAGVLGASMTGVVIGLLLFIRRATPAPAGSNDVTRANSPSFSLAHGATVVVVVGVVLLLASGVFYALPGVWWFNVMLLACVPLFPWLAEIQFIRRHTDGRAFRSALVRIGLAALPATVAVMLAVVRFVNALSDDPYAGY